MRKRCNYIDGEWIGDQAPAIDVTNPATGEILVQVPDIGRQGARQAVDAAAAAFPSWSRHSAYERAEFLKTWHALIEGSYDALARTMTLEQGKPLKEAVSEMRYANGFISWYAEEAKRVYGEMIPASQRDKRLLVLKQPIGVVAVITPWNFPAAMIARKVAPALAAGCTVVIKPAIQTPLTAFDLVELAERAGFPKGVINVVTGKAAEIGDAWMADARVRKISFTGSTEVGKEIMRGCAATMKRVSLELGGHAPAIVMADADLDKAVEAIVGAKFRNAGQTCICVNRIYVQESVHDAFAAKFVDRVRALRMGNGLTDGIDIGPLIDRSAVDKVLEQIEQAVAAGAVLQTGGRNTEGLFVQPAVLTGVSDEMVCMSEETFGPLAPIATFKTTEEVINRANDSVYGLAAYVFTESISAAFLIAEALEYGIIGVNEGAPSAPQAPFGGMKESGIGREGGRHGMDEYLEIKYMSMALA